MSAQLVSVRPDDLLRLHEDVERKSNAIQRLWKERDELRKRNEELLAALKRIQQSGAFVGAIAKEMMDAAIEKAEKK